MDCMHMLLCAGARRLDALQGAQLAAQEALGVMAVVMLRQQGAMHEVSCWESEVEGAMRGDGEEGGGRGV